MMEKIMNFIKDSKEHPTMKELLDEFLVYSGEDIHFLTVIQELRNEGKLFYDEKHDAWLYTASDNPKLRTLIEKSVCISDLK